MISVSNIPLQWHRHTGHARVLEIIKEARDAGVKVFIAILGLAAHLPGVAASHTIKPVIRVPVNAALDGMDARLSIAQMLPKDPGRIYRNRKGR